MPRIARQMARVAVGSAVMAGTANAVSRRQQKRWAGQDAAAMQGQQDAYNQGMADAQASMAQAPQQPQAAPAQDSSMAELEKLADLKNKGILTEEEFQAKKKQILGI